jgi:general secretion pathway protein D
MTIPPPPSQGVPWQEIVAGLTESLDSKGVDAKKTEQLPAINTNVDKINEPAVLTTPLKPKPAKNNHKSAARHPLRDLEYESTVTTAPKETVPAFIKTEMLSPGKISIASDSNVTNKTQPSPSTTINLPVLLDNPAMVDSLVSVNFDQADIRVVLKTISDITGINFVVDESVKGTVTVISPTTIRLGEVYEVLESILEVKGFAAVPAEGVVKIIPKAEAAQRNLQVRIGGNPSDIPKSDSLVTQIIPLSHADATEVSQIIKPLLAKSSYMATYSRTNSILITDISSNIHYIAKIIQQLDVQQPTKASNFHVAYLKNAQAKEVAESLTTALISLKRAGAIEAVQNVQVTPDEGTNALIITASARDYEIIADIIEKLDIVREQVLVEMLIMEISEDNLKEIGIDWATLDEAVTNSVRFFGATNFGPRVDLISGDLEGLAVGIWKKHGDTTSYGSVLQALEKLSGVNILSTPHILTSNHHKARIIVGENVPYVTQSRITETTDLLTPTVIKTYEYKDVGISLQITPHISQGGLIRLEIDSEFTKLIEGVTTASTDTPTTAKRQAQTVISMKSGSTVVIGGLIRDDKVTLEKKIPLIGDIPLLGELFKYRKDRLQKTNLLIFITPHVMGTQEDLEQITDWKKKEMELKQKMFEEDNKKR